MVVYSQTDCSGGRFFTTGGAEELPTLDPGATADFIIAVAGLAFTGAGFDLTSAALAGAGAGRSLASARAITGAGASSGTDYGTRVIALLPGPCSGKPLGSSWSGTNTKWRGHNRIPLKQWLRGCSRMV